MQNSEAESAQVWSIYHKSFKINSIKMAIRHSADPATQVNSFMRISRYLKICEQVESRRIVAGYSAVALNKNIFHRNTYLLFLY